jgi:hypothetical protein
MRRLLLLALVLPMFGCGGADPAFVAISCPTNSVLAQAAFVTKHAAGGATPANTILTASMGPGLVGCDYDQEDFEVTFDLSMPITATRGPAGSAGPHRLTYFVAVLDPAGNMLSKRVFERDVNFGGANSANWNERVRDSTIRLPQGRRPVEYQIVTGFQLTPAELAYNQTQRNFQP